MDGIKEFTLKAEKEYADCPPSGRGKGEIEIDKNEILKQLKPISIRKPMVMAVGSVATQGESNNDLDIVIRGEDFGDKIKEAIDFRLYRYFSKVLNCDYDDVTKYVQIHYNNAGSYTSYIPLFELTLEPIQKNEVVHMGDEQVPMHMFGQFDVIEKAMKSNRKIIAGYASVIEVDREGHYIPKSALEDGIKTLLSDDSYSNLMLIHKNIQIGKILKKYNGLRTHVDDNGLFIVAELRDDLESARNVWEMIEDGDINSFSIAGEIILSHDECDETKCVRIIDKMNIYEVSVCDIPVNKKSGFMVVSKEENAFENVLCKSLNKGVELMSKKKDCECNETIEKAEVDKPEEIKKSEDTKKSEPETETKEKSEDVEKQEEEEEMPEEEEKTSEQIVESIERRLETLEGMVQELAKKPSEYPYPEKEEKQEEEEEDMEEEEEKSEKPEEQQLLDDAIGMIAEVLNISPSKVKDALGGLTNKKEDKEEYPYPMPAEKELDEIKNSIQELAKSLKSEDESKEIETLIKSKEDEIAALNERIETLEKAEVPPKTTTEVEEEREDVVIDKPKSKFAKDSLGTGVWYKDPDL